MKKYIGNIIVGNQSHKVEDCFKKCKTLEEIDDKLPSLVIGLENAKENIVGFSILKREYEKEMLWWTFSIKEKRIGYEKDIVDFKKFCIDKIIGNFKFTSVNYVDLRYSDAKKYINYITGNVIKYYYIDNDKFIFVYDKENKCFYGFSLNTFDFFGIPKKKIINLFEKNDKNVKIKNFFSIPRNIRTLVNDDIPSKMILFEYF